MYSNSRHQESLHSLTTFTVCSSQNPPDFVATEKQQKFPEFLFIRQNKQTLKWSSSVVRIQNKYKKIGLSFSVWNTEHWTPVK